MKILTLFTLLLSAIACQGQIGTYCTEPNYTGFCYELKANGAFQYNEASCTHASQGIGDFEIVGDTIKFQFKKHELTGGGYQITKIGELEKEVLVDLRVVDSLSRETIEFYNAALYSNGVLMGGKTADIEGKTTLHATFNQETISIEVQVMLYHPVTLEINEPGHYAVVAELASGWATPEPEHERIYRLITLNRDSLVLGSFDEEKWTRTLFRLKK